MTRVVIDLSSATNGVPKVTNSDDKMSRFTDENRVEIYNSLKPGDIVLKDHANNKAVILKFFCMKYKHVTSQGIAGSDSSYVYTLTCGTRVEIINWV